MDPNATIWRFLDADTAEERRLAAQDYNAWISRGGFKGKVMFCGVERTVTGLSGSGYGIYFETEAKPYRAHASTDRANFARVSAK